MSLRTEAFRDNPHRLALMYGPILLCTQTEAGKRFAVALTDPQEVAKNLKPIEGSR